MTVRMTCMECGKELSQAQLDEALSVARATIHFGTTVEFEHQCKEKK